MFKLFRKLKELLDSVSLTLNQLSVWKLNATYELETLKEKVKELTEEVQQLKANKDVEFSPSKQPLKGDTFDNSEELLATKQLLSSNYDKLVEQLAIELGKNSAFLTPLGQEIAKNPELQQKVVIYVSRKIAGSLSYDRDINTGAIINNDGTTNFLDC